jgi:hypothetical protein
LGGLTNSPPPFPGFSTPIAIVINAAATNVGSIFVRMKTGEYLSQLHDVDISTKASGDIIIWNTAVSAWTNSQAFVQTQASVSALNVQVAAVSALTSDNTAAITSINNVVSALEIRVSAVSALASANAAAITSTNNVVSALEIRVSAVSAVAGTNAAAITSINNVVSALEVRVSSVSAATSVNVAAIASVNAVVSLRVLRAGDTMTGPLNVVVSSDIIGVSVVGGLVVTSLVNFVGNSALLVHAGTTAARPTSAVPGMLRFNSGSNSFEGYVSAEWGAIGGGGGATGGGNDQIFFLNDQVVSVAYSIPSGKNAGTFGPITIASGVTVVVPTSSYWTVV